jgi:pimeloyl-ACP methyl ester carboxylesterase
VHAPRPGGEVGVVTDHDERAARLAGQPGDRNPTFAAFIERVGEEYMKNAPTSDQYHAFLNQIGAMWAMQPNWTAAELARIRTPVMIVNGGQDEAIRWDHTEELARQVPGAQLLILPGVSQFAMLQKPAEFNAAVLKFLAG